MDEKVANTNVYGKTLIQSFYLGTNYSAAFVCLEYKGGPLAAFYPYATLGQLGTIAESMYDIAQPLVLTAVGGAIGLVPATLTANKAIMMPGAARRLVYGPTLRKVPIRMQLFPYQSGQNSIIHFSST